MDTSEKRPAGYNRPPYRPVYDANANIMPLCREAGLDPLNYATHDFLLFSGVHEANPIELKYALRASSRLLVPNGYLMLAAPLMKNTTTMTPYGTQLSWATEAGLIPEWEGNIATGNAGMGTDTLSGVALLRKAEPRQ